MGIAGWRPVFGRCLPPVPPHVCPGQERHAQGRGLLCHPPVSRHHLVHPLSLCWVRVCLGHKQRIGTRTNRFVFPPLCPRPRPVPLPPLLPQRHHCLLPLVCPSQADPGRRRRGRPHRAPRLVRLWRSRTP